MTIMIEARTNTRRRRQVPALALVVLFALGGCAPPTEIVDLQSAPQSTRDAMQGVIIAPVGTPGPPEVGSIGPVSGYGCGQSKEEAGRAAVDQLRVKALALHATAVVNVLVEPEGIGICAGGQNMMARGIAVGPRGIPSSY